MSYSLAFTQALFVVLYIADKVAQGIHNFTPTQAISDDLGIPPSSASVILRKLNRAGVVETREGAGGGVRLSRSPADVTVLDILLAIEQERPLFQTNFSPSVSGEKPTRGQEAIVATLHAGENAMKNQLQTVSIQDLLVLINR